MLDERKIAILRAVVQEYIETAQPVGSSHVARARGVNVSPATVRNEMAVLEQEGYLVQPHTSAGRIPTDKGYRSFVDNLGHPGRLDAARKQQIREFFASAHGAIEQMLDDTSRLLSGVTNYAAVVIGPPHEGAVVRSVQVVGLTGHLVMVVVVLSNGTIENETIELDDDVDDARLAAASAHLSQHLVGETLPHRGAVPPTADAGLDDLCTRAVTALAGSAKSSATDVYVGGASRMASAFDAVEVVRTVLDTLEQQYVVVSLLRDVLDRGLSVAIGVEHGVEPLASCSVVVMPYVVEGEPLGTIGVLGPTRMNYPQALAAVEVVSDRLGRRLSEG
jgi:heat-inducible transcriptional repressor